MGRTEDFPYALNKTETELRRRTPRVKACLLILCTPGKKRGCGGHDRAALNL